MHPAISHAFLAGADLPAPDRQTLVQAGIRLCEGKWPIGVSSSLTGCHIAIATPDPQAAAAQLTAEAARGLGAQVSFIGPLDVDAVKNAASLARMLARLYDALDCAQLAPAEALELERLAGIPVFLELGAADHRLRALASELGTPVDHCAGAADGKALRLVQAALLVCIG